MWGYLDNLTVQESTNNIGSIPLTRAVARLDISVNESVNFELTSARLYYHYNAGHVAPEAIAGGTYESDPYPVASSKQTGYIEYTTATGAFKEKIYTHETAPGIAVPTNGWKTNTCLVIGGKYNGDSSPVTYYRVELVDNSGPLALSRNHLYNVVIQDVKSHGWHDHANALDNLPTNITVEIIEWNSSNLNHVDFGEHHYIAVDRNRVDLYRDGDAKTLRVATNYPAGWSIEIPTSSDWIQVSPTTYNGGQGEQEQTITVSASSEATTARSGEFYIVVGNLKKKITVDQSDLEEISLEVSPLHVLFYANPTADIPLTVTTVPADLPRSFSYAGDVVWDDGKNPADWVSTTDASYPLRPTNHDGDGARGGLITVFVTRDGKTLARTVEVTQLDRDPIYSVAADPTYPAAGGPYTLDVMAEESWKLAPAYAYDWLDLGDQSTYHAPLDLAAPQTFILGDNSSNYLPRTATVHLMGSFSPSSPWHTFNIVQQGTPPFILVTDPASKTVDLDATTDPVTIQTNANWWIETDARYANVIGDVTVEGLTVLPGSSNVQVGSSSAAVKVNRAVTFSLSATAATDVPVGTPLTSVVTFHTHTGLSSVNEASDQVTFTRLNPYIFNFAGYSIGASPGNPSQTTPVPITHAGATVHLHVNTNVSWWGKLNEGVQVDQAINSYTENSTIEFTVPALDRTNPDNWDNTIASTIHYGPTLEGAIPSSLDIAQEGHTLAVKNIVGGGVKVTLDVDASDGSYWILIIYDATNLTKEVASASGTGSAAKKTATLPASSTEKDYVIYNNVTKKQVGTFKTSATDYVICGPITLTSSYKTPCPDGYERADNPNNMDFFSTATLKNFSYGDTFQYTDGEVLLDYILFDGSAIQSVTVAILHSATLTYDTGLWKNVTFSSKTVNRNDSDWGTYKWYYLCKAKT
jgi:hypothetical protein